MVKRGKQWLSQLTPICRASPWNTTLTLNTTWSKHSNCVDNSCVSFAPENTKSRVSKVFTDGWHNASRQYRQNLVNVGTAKSSLLPRISLCSSRSMPPWAISEVQLDHWSSSRPPRKRRLSPRRPSTHSVHLLWSILGCCVSTISDPGMARYFLGVLSQPKIGTKSSCNRHQILLARVYLAYPNSGRCSPSYFWRSLWWCSGIGLGHLLLPATEGGYTFPAERMT